MQKMTPGGCINGETFYHFKRMHRRDADTLVVSSVIRIQYITCVELAMQLLYVHIRITTFGASILPYAHFMHIIIIIISLSVYVSVLVAPMVSVRF